VSVDKSISSIREAIDGMARFEPEKPFLISPETETQVSFQELQQQSNLLSGMLHQADLEKGDKVAFLMDNGLLTAELFLGTMYGGFVAVPLNVRAGAMQLSYMLDHCDAKLVFVEEQYTVLLREALGNVRRDMRVIVVGVDGPMPAFETVTRGQAPQPLSSDDPALLIYSSGSTGKPKGAIHTHNSVLAHGWNSIQAHEMTSSDRSLLVLPLYHINAECVTLIPTLLSGGSVVVAHRFVVSKFWDWIDDLKITWSALVPTIISELVDWNDPGKDHRQEAFARIRFFRSSSAPLSPTLHQQFIDKFHLPLLQAMGSTEGGNVFSNPVPPGKNKIGSPGLPWGFETRIVDRAGTDVPRGESGEMLLRGRALMKGYYKDPEGTAAVVDSEGWLHTGDLARQDEDGYFFVVGRSKELIIKGGVNIAPRQIDEVLESHPAVLEAAAVGVPDRYFGEDAVAFVVLRSEPTADERELLAYCETRLGHFKTPSRIHFLKELPKGPSGKVQRLKLLDPAILAAVAATTQPANETTGSGSEINSQTTGSAIEKIIATAWAEVLSLPEVDSSTNFFALGGHSLLAIQCLSKLRDKLPIVLTLADFFQFSTVAEQAELVRARLRPAADAGQSANWEQSLLQQYVPPATGQVIPALNSTLPQPLSPAQQRLWFMDRMNPDVPVYNESEAVRLTGELDVDALERAMNVIVDRHEVLRSTIKEINGVPHAVIHGSWPLRFKRIDLTALTPAKLEAEVDRLLIDEVRIPYNLETTPGIRVSLLKISPREHVFILMMHHSVCDWGSEGIIWRELSAAYRAFLQGQQVVLPALPVTHADYVAWQHKRLANTDFAEDLAFWEETLRGAPALLELPADRPRPPMMSYKGGRLRWKLSNALTEALRNTSRNEKTSLFTIFSAALDTLIHRYTGSEDISLGIPLADRDHQELQSVVGFLLHVHVLRTRLSGDITFRDLISRVQKGALDLYAHRTAPFDQIVQKLQPERNLSYTPLFQVMFNWRDRDQMLSFIGLEGLTVDSLMAHADTSKFDLLLFATDTGDEIWLEPEFNTDLFDEDRMQRMLGHFQTLLEGIVADPGRRLSELPVLTAEEEHRLAEWNHTAVDYPRDVRLHNLFEAQAGKTPDAVAVEFDGQPISYSELNRRSNQLAHHLTALGIGPEVLVGICVERSIDMVVGVLGILKAGGAYVPLDPSFPQARLSHMIEDSKMSALLTHRGLEEQLEVVPDSIVRLDSDWSRIEKLSPDSAGLPVAGSESRAYVLYTSGSTGKPKGVEIPHSAIVNFLLSMQREPGFSAHDILLAVTTLSFDIAGLELYLPLISGGRVMVASREVTHDPMRLLELVEESGCTVMQATPATWRGLIQAGWTGSPNLKVLCGGEALPRDLAEELLTRCGELWNMYGPTETTVWSTIHKVTSGDGPVPIGKPIANTQLYVLDAERSLVPQGNSGELYIGGDGLARGYLHREELTRERFVPNPFASGERLYRTGDLARWLADGTVECLGRVDNQVKIRGFRIELGEIEARLSEYPGVGQAAVIAREDTPGDKRLVAYYTNSQAGEVGTEQFRSHMSATLPEYMVPAVYMRLDTLPLTPNGKLDRKALPAPEVDAILTRGYELPQGDTEERLAEIWAKVLKVERVGRNDNFFDLGGHSLLMAQVQAIVSREFNTKLSIVELFQYPTTRSLARHMSTPSSSSARPQKAQERTRRRKEAMARSRELKG
jgi:amino acid adenylation domain-containing protein